MIDEYDFEAKFYDKIWGRHDYETDVKFLNKLFKNYSCKKVLDIGCGTGNHAIGLASLGYRVTGVDVSDKMLEIARNKIHNRKIDLKQGDMKDIARISQRKIRWGIYAWQCRLPSEFG